ncbi:hypothetical protein SASPL_110162 [Salvia splendens]|uniref:Transcription repressor n=1 Tax=Salvia splendens TaxID=180675 RepID=A0A8X9A316_SALSN|nr:hypothetical protein SASPL_110162 [Salvia splendens]
MTYSPDPYDDFRRSMQEMVEVRLEHNRNVDWKFLEELLFCYLDLNNKKSYRFILRAFADVIVLLREIRQIAGEYAVAERRRSGWEDVKHA